VSITEQKQGFPRKTAVNDDNLTTLTFKVTPDALAIIEAQAEKAGMNRSEYLRARALETREHADNVMLLRFIIFILQRIHSAIYMMPQAAGDLSIEQLREIYERTEAAGRNCMPGIDERIAALGDLLRPHPFNGELKKEN
jgi:hypothetical protein